MVGFPFIITNFCIAQKKILPDIFRHLNYIFQDLIARLLLNDCEYETN